MNKNRLLFVALIGLFLTIRVFAQEKPFVIVIASYNNCDWYDKNLASVLDQNYSNYRIIYIDDNSPDNTGNLVQAYLEEHDIAQRTHLIKNSERKGALRNYCEAIWSCDPYEIVLTVDGDDWLKNPDVLATLNGIYANDTIWLTYGQFVFYPSDKMGFCKEYPQDVVKNNSYRDHKFFASHLRTFYAGFFQKIDHADFLDPQGNFYPMAWDLAFMLPMLEMSAGEHTACVDTCLYVYNRANVINDHKVNQQLQHHLAWEVIRKKPRYAKLERLF